MAFFQKIIDELDSSGALLEAQTEVVNTLQELAETKAQLYESDIMLLLAGAGLGVDQTVPISSIIAQNSTARAFTSTSTADLASEISETLEAFLGGSENGPPSQSALAGIAKIMTTSLTLFFGESAGTSGEERQYYLYTTPFSIYRVDTAAWFRQVTAQAIQTRMTKAVCVAYANSIVAVEELTWSEFNGIYNAQLDVEDLTQEEIQEARQEAREAWNYMKGEEEVTEADLLSGL